MKMRERSRDYSQEQDSKTQRRNKKSLKNQIRMKQFVFEDLKPKKKKRSSGEAIENDTNVFWNQVNESLILPPNKNINE